VVGLGALQVVLDKGQREDWFSSGLIVRLSLVAAACLIAFIIVELRSPEPVVKLRLFKKYFFRRRQPRPIFRLFCFIRQHRACSYIFTAVNGLYRLSGRV